MRRAVRTRVFVSSAAVLLAVGSASSASAAIIATDDPTPQEQLAQDIVADAGSTDRQWDDVDRMESILPEKAEAAPETAQSDPAEVPAEEEPVEEETSEASSGPSVDISAECSDYSGNQAIGCTMTLDAGWDMGEFQCLVDLWNRESGWNETAYNEGSGAYGIPQSLPGDKMASHGDDWETNPATQIAWGLDYIEGRYGSPCGAWSHSESNGWY
ncbi:lytic transglycosylase domain-containing protein [Glycomyces terrestris]|uniref:Lytic transglycosylase domain-containing protein n=1 Tax=Glycomyces terrestris TaxID=2493553 RepID=A0A426V606_9ACTN|nr:lytic transglycosylase domain-containing protein [Glycomyces terrestris]